MCLLLSCGGEGGAGWGGAGHSMLGWTPPGLGDIHPGHWSQLSHQFLCGLGKATLICRPRSQAPFPHGHLLAWQQEPGNERGRRARKWPEKAASPHVKVWL